MPQSVPTGWTQADHSLTRTMKCVDFVDALALVLVIGKLAEKADHHPDIDIRYNTLHLSLCTHSAGHTVTAKDFDLAQKINDLNDDSLRLNREDLKHRFAA